MTILLNTLKRYCRIYLALAKYCLVREMSFRGHFLINSITEGLWFFLLLIFFKVIYLKVSTIAGWTEYQVLFLLGTHHLIIQFFELVFFANCVELADEIRTGKLDFVLLKPINAQFLLSVRRLRFSSAVNIPVALVIIFYASYKLELRPDVSQVLAYCGLIFCSIMILYSIIFMLSLSAFWVIRNESIFQLWFPVTNFARYPMDMYSAWLQVILIFVFPVLAVANFPAKMMVKTLEPGYAIYACCWALVALLAGHFLFRFALSRYRSASS
tara:strand:- start:248 stop:1057 length:810 start_codon:yes stop_codon:yes gene_type:complete